MKRCSTGTTRSIIRFGIEPPFDRVETREIGVVADGVDHMGASPDG